MVFGIKLNNRHRVALFVTLIAAGICLVSGETMRTGLGVVLLGIAFAWAFGSDARLVHYLFLSCGLSIVIGSVMYDWRAHGENVKLYERQVADFERRIPNLAKSYPLLPYPLPPVSYDPSRGTITVPLSQLGRQGQVQSLIADPQFQSLSSAGKRKALARIDPEFAKLSDAGVEKLLSDLIPDEGFIPDPTQNYSPPVGLRLTRKQLLAAIRTKEPVYKSAEDKSLMDDFLNMYPNWQTALVDGTALADSQPEWYIEAVEKGVNVPAIPDEEKPGEPPEGFRLWQPLYNEWIFTLPGLFLFFVGGGLILRVKPSGTVC